MAKVTVTDILRMKAERRRVVMMAAYYYEMARAIDRAQPDMLLVGDSGAKFLLGHRENSDVTLDEMIVMTRSVARGAQHALVVCDMPFMSYQVSVEEAVRNAGRFLQVGAAAVKIEGGEPMTDRVEAMTRVGIPVVGHLGMTPQSVNKYGGYRVQGKGQDQAERLRADAQSLEAAGAFAVVLEAIPIDLAKSMTKALTIPTIGIGAGPHCDGQVLVLYDLLGLFDEFVPKFVKPYAHLRADALQALRRYKEEVENGKFPSDDESYH